MSLAQSLGADRRGRCGNNDVLDGRRDLHRSGCTGGVRMDVPGMRFGHARTEKRRDRKDHDAKERRKEGA